MVQVDRCGTGVVRAGRKVRYYRSDISCTVRLLELTCSICGMDREASPAEIGCFSNTITAPAVVYDIQLIELYSQLQQHAGVGGASFKQALEGSHQGALWCDLLSSMKPLDKKCVDLLWQLVCDAACSAIGSSSTLALMLQTHQTT